MYGRHLIWPSPEGRLGAWNPYWSGKRGQHLFMIGVMFIAVQCLFLADISYIFGAFFEDGTRVYHLKILMVNFDDGALADSLRTAYQALEAPTFPKSYEFNVSQYPTPEDVIHAVYTGEYWGAIYTHAGASDRLTAALNGQVDSYDASKAMTYVWNGARYPNQAEAYIEANMEQAFLSTTATYYQLNGTYALEAVAKSMANSSNPIPAQAMYNPIAINDYNIKVTTQGVRAVYGAIPFVMSILIEFFFLMAVNGISSHFQLYSLLSIPANGLSLIYTFVGSCCFSGLIWAFQEDWNLPTRAYFEMWMIFWLHMHINFCVIDVFTAIVPLQFLSFFVLTWVLLNISSSLQPFELIHGFYRWGYAMPAHETMTVLIQIWSGGCNYLYRALPILFSEEVAALFAAYVALIYRCDATKKTIEKEKLRQKDLEAGVTSGVTFHFQATANEAREDMHRIESQYFPNGAITLNDDTSPA